MYGSKQSTETRRNRAAQRKRELRIKMAATGIIVTLVVSVIVVRYIGGHSDSVSASAKQVATTAEETVLQGDGDSNSQETVDQEAFASLQADAQAAARAQLQRTSSNTYPTMGTNYQELATTVIKCPYVALLDVDSNKVIAGRSSTQRIYPASMTKVMTLIVAVEHLKSLEDTYTMTNEILYPLVRAEATRAGFDPGEVVNAKDMLYGLILPSGADASICLANMISGSEAQFAVLMNQKAQELGLKDTHFTNTSGLHDSNHYTTPTDMAVIMAYAMKNPICSQVLSTYTYTTAPTPQHPQGIPLVSNMYSRMYGNEVEGVIITGGKTGYTGEALQCLVSYAIKDGNRYVAVTTGATNKWSCVYDTFELYRNYALTAN